MQKSISFSMIYLFHLGPRTQTSNCKGMKKVQTHQKVCLLYLIKRYLLISTDEPTEDFAMPLSLSQGRPCHSHKTGGLRTFTLCARDNSTYLLKISLIPWSFFFFPLEILHVVSCGENLSCTFSF